MAGGFRSRAFKDIDLLEIAETFFEPQLRMLGLTIEKIGAQTLPELELTLERVNEAIKNPDAFGRMRVELGIDTGQLTALLVKSTGSSTMEIGILPLLLERKKLILDRIRLLRGDEKIENLRDLIEKVPQEEIRVKLEREITSLEVESQKLHQQAQELEKEQEKEQLRTQKEIDKLTLKTTLFERRSKVWQSFLERESVATIVGGCLLMIITVFLIVAILIHVVSSDILNNSFLVILVGHLPRSLPMGEMG